MKFGKLAGIATLATLLLSATGNDAEARKTKHPVKKPPVKARQAPRQPGMRDQLPNKANTTALTIYFPTNSWTLDRGDYDSIASFVHAHPRASHWIVEGHADERSTDDWNNYLGDKRAKGVAKFVRSYGGHGSMDTTSYGEGKPANQGHDKSAWRQNRRVVVRVDQSTIETALANLPGDIYVLDASSSMNDAGKWGAVARYKFGAGKELYAFSTCFRGEGHVKSIHTPSEVEPCESTPLWQAIDYVVRTHPGKKITVLTDGEDTEGGISPEGIIAEAQQSHTLISIGEVEVVRPEVRATLEKVANSTGGHPYIVVEKSSR